MNKLIGFTSLFTHKKQLALFFCLVIIPFKETLAHIGPSYVFLSDTAIFRVNMISFFLACILLCSFFIKDLWNYLKNDFSFLPFLSFRKSLVISLLFGLIFLMFFILSSGTSSLLTAETWTEKKKLTSVKPVNQNQINLEIEKIDKHHLFLERKMRLIDLKEFLWRYASLNEGEFPESIESSQIPEKYWKLPQRFDLKYQYFPGQKLSENQKPSVLVSELDFYDDRQFVLQTDGTFHHISKQEWNDLQKSGEEK
jgi:hypothetical protein